MARDRLTGRRWPGTRFRPGDFARSRSRTFDEALVARLILDVVHGKVVGLQALAGQVHDDVAALAAIDVSEGAAVRHEGPQSVSRRPAPDPMLLGEATDVPTISTPTGDARGHRHAVGEHLRRDPRPENDPLAQRIAARHAMKEGRIARWRRTWPTANQGNGAARYTAGGEEGAWKFAAWGAV
jgi:hypothetical protein